MGTLGLGRRALGDGCNTGTFAKRTTSRNDSTAQ